MNKAIKQLLFETYPNMTQKEIAKLLLISEDYFGPLAHPIGMKLAARFAKATGKPIMLFYNK